ncbi:hypothetical protein [Alteribacter natronophilus]|uniref:hypothetical protein n=1 Tax=Alteribacter natronophilus TaxID=2583810 RepID=UPI0014869A03|nr:hypothetical protein [Alteribacter natronophilus]TMW70970.1 hypothetical protein FGB90_13430 [Alteribacter natronophilus]
MFLSYDLLLALLMSLDFMQPLLFNQETVGMELNPAAFVIKPLTFSFYGVVIDLLIRLGQRNGRRRLTVAEMQELTRDELPKQ